MSDHIHDWEQQIGRDGVYWKCHDCSAAEVARTPAEFASLEEMLRLAAEEWAHRWFFSDEWEREAKKHIVDLRNRL